MKVLNWTACILIIALSGCDSKPSSNSNTSSGSGKVTKKRRIAVVPRGSTHDFWKSIHVGAVKASRELGNVDILFKGPEKEDDREQQVLLVQNYLGGSVDAVILAPLDETALLPPVRQ